MTIKLLAPNPYQQFQTRSGTNYTADAFGVVSGVPIGQDIIDLTNGGCISLGIVGARSNLSATVDPVVGNDSTQDYGVGSRWLNLTSGVEWICQSAASGAAVWIPQISTGMLIGRIIGANMNSTADQAVALTNWSALSKYRVTKITAKNASISLTTAQGGVYTAASKGGTAIVASTQAYTALSAATLAVDLTIVTTPGVTVWNAATPLFLALSTAQGAAATADLYVFGDVYV